MNARVRQARGLGLSLAVHGVFTGSALWLWHNPPAPPEPEPVRWEISLYTPPPPTPPAPAPAPEPAPQPVAAPPPPAPHPLPPKPKPKPVVKQKPKPKPPPKPVTRYLRAEPPADEAPAPERIATPPVPPRPVAAPAAPRGPLVADVPPAPKEQPDFGWLKRYLVEKAMANKHYPPEARENGWEGRVVIKFVIASNGSLVRASVVRSSGHEALDQAALSTLRRITPVPTSSAHRWTEVSLSMPFDYKLNR